MLAGAGGGTGVTTYAENIGVMAVTRIYSTLVFVVAAITAIVLGFSPKFGALIGTIPGPVLGGLAIVVFGLITATGARIWVVNNVDFGRRAQPRHRRGDAHDRRRRSCAAHRRIHARRHRHRDVRRDHPLPALARRAGNAMTLRLALLAFVTMVLAGCATRQVNPPITEVHPTEGYRFLTRDAKRIGNNAKDTLVVLTFSGGGTRAAAFAYGVLEVLRKTEMSLANGNRGRLIDGIDIITGVSGGSFTALAYGLYGDKLFDSYEKRFLKRNVESALLQGTLNPMNWAELSSDKWGRSEMAAKLYDEILFDGATFADLERGSGPIIMVQTTDISTGSRFAFTQPSFDLICSDLSKVRLARAAAASSAVPLVLSPITLNNYGGTCGFKYPDRVKLAADPDNPARPAARAIKRLEETLAYQDSKARPYLHLVDGGSPTTSACAPCSRRWRRWRRCAWQAARRRSTTSSASWSSS